MKIFKLIVIYFDRLKNKGINISQAIKYQLHYYFNKKNVILVNGYLQYRNIGDWLNNFLIEEISGKRVIDYNSLLFQKNKKHLLAIGSVIHLANRNSIIWGSGMISDSIILKDAPYKIEAIRGPMTRERLLEQELICPEIYGDPALLLPQFYSPKNIIKKYKIGVIPHYVDNKFANIFFKDVASCLILDIECGSNWRIFIDNMLSCETIISSSLHGIILADAYQIPNTWVLFSKMVIGNGFKFEDYYQSVGKEKIQPLQISNNIDINQIRSQFHNWRPPVFSYSALLKSFPSDLH